jgi:long-chain acyl-CoA synthetase
MELGYPQLWAHVNALAGWLHAQGLDAGTLVGLAVRTEYRHLVASLALMRLGCPQITLPTHESAAYRQRLAVRAGVTCQLADAAIPALAGLMQRTLPSHLPEVGYPPTLPLRDTASAYVLFVTSGTTGLPKLTPLDPTQIVQQADRCQEHSRPEVLWRPTPIEFNNAKRHRLYAVATGSVNVFADPSPGGMLDVVETQQVTRLHLSVVQARQLLAELRACNRQLPSGCQLRLSGSMIAADLRTALRTEVTPALYLSYGTTEFGVVAITGPEHLDNPTCAGRPQPGVDVEIVDTVGNTLPCGELGHIRLRGPGMCTGYLDDAAASAQSFRNGWFHPGDMGRIDADGRLHVHGRVDDMMSLAGINIFPTEIEHAYADWPGMLECAAFAMPSTQFGDIPILAVVVDDHVDLDAMQRHGRARLGLRAPRKLIRIEAIPRNPTGKVLRAELVNWFAQQRRAP